MSENGVGGEKFRVGRVLARSFSVLFRNIGPVGLLALAMLSVPYVLGYFLEFRYSGGPFSELETDPWSWRVTLGTTLQLLVTACLEAVVAFGAYETLQGRRPGARALVRGGLVRFPAVLPVVVVVTVPQALPFVVHAVSFEVPWVGEARLPAILLFILAWVFLFVAIPAAAVEGLGVKRGIERSFELVRSSMFRVIGLILLVSAMMIAAFATPSLLLEWAGVDLAAAPYHLLVWPDFLLTAFGSSLWAVMGTVAFHDLRVFREGPDLTRVAAVFD